MFECNIRHSVTLHLNSPHTVNTLNKCLSPKCFPSQTTRYVIIIFIVCTYYTCICTCIHVYVHVHVHVHVYTYILHTFVYLGCSWSNTKYQEDTSYVERK